MNHTTVMTSNHTYKVIKRKEENEHVVTLTLTLLDGTIPRYVSGQYMTIYFPESKVKEGKAYSISSAAHEKKLTVTVKDIGVFSHMLCSLEAGDTVEGSLPYGFFFSEEEETSLIMLASGIGITPLMSLIKDVLHKHPSRTVHLEYSIKHLSDGVFLDALKELTEQHTSFTFVVSVTQEEAPYPWTRSGRIVTEEVVVAHDVSKNAEYFVCGSIAFVRDTWRTLRGVGVKEENVYTEAFFG